MEYNNLGSTNAEALALARAGERGPLWIVAQRQTAGRGRRGRDWQTLEGNLAATFLITCDVPLATAATLGFAAGVALDAALTACAPGVAGRVALKWPNDVLADGKKLAGILLESEPTVEGFAIAVGIGVNVAAAPQGLPQPAISLAELGVACGSERLFTALTDAWFDFFGVWDDGKGMAAIRQQWLDRAAGVGGEVTIRAGGKNLRGVFETLDEQGRLILRKGDGESVAVAAGEAYFGDAATWPRDAEIADGR